MALKLASATYALAGTGTIQERLIKTWDEALARISKKDIPPDLRGLYEEIDTEFKRMSKLSGPDSMPDCLLQFTDDEAIAIAETIVLLSLEFAKLQGVLSARK